MGGFGMWTQVWSKGSCVGKAFCSPNYIFMGSEFMELKTTLMWLRGKALPW